MNGDDGVHLLWGVGALVLVLSSLAARRTSVGFVIRSILGWLVILGILFVIISNRDQIMLWAERIGLGDQQVVGDTIRIRQALDGHFYANARINGVSTRMLIDSGATITALSGSTASKAGVRPSQRLPVLLTTANGSVSAQRGVAETFAIGDMETRDLSVVVSPAFGDVNVVGMNFLSRLGSWRVEGRMLILEPNKSI